MEWLGISAVAFIIFFVIPFFVTPHKARLNFDGLVIKRARDLVWEKIDKNGPLTDELFRTFQRYQTPWPVMQQLTKGGGAALSDPEIQTLGARLLILGNIPKVVGDRDFTDKEASDLMALFNATNEVMHVLGMISDDFYLKNFNYYKEFSIPKAFR